MPLKLYDMKKGLYAYNRGDIICAVNVGNEIQYINIKNKQVVFSYGEYTALDDKVYLLPKSMLILK